MGGLFSTLSKQLLSSLVLTAGLPAVAFVAGFQAFVAPYLPGEWHLLEAPEALEAEWKTAFAALAVLVAAAALTALNGPLIRLYEGYPLLGSWIGGRMRERHWRRAREAEVWWQGARAVLRGADRVDPKPVAAVDKEAGAALGALWQRVGQTLPRLYPRSGRSPGTGRALPTRLGNVIRAFEDYPSDKYGIYGVTLWPRLAATMEESYAKRIQDAKQPFDLMLNGSFASFALAALTLVAGLAWPARRGHDLAAWSVWLAVVAGLVALGWVCYLLALPRAAAWGDAVKGAYDLYRWQLMERLGFPERPRTMVEEKELWRRIGGHMLFGRMATADPLEYGEAEPAGPEEAPWLRALRELVREAPPTTGGPR